MWTESIRVWTVQWRTVLKWKRTVEAPYKFYLFLCLNVTVFSITLIIKQAYSIEKQRDYRITNWKGSGRGLHCFQRTDFRETHRCSHTFSLPSRHTKLCNTFHYEVSSENYCSCSNAHPSVSKTKL
jgi:hypothetical protein